MVTAACTFTASFPPPAAPTAEPSSPPDEGGEDGSDPTTGSGDSGSGASTDIETRQDDEAAAVGAVDRYWQRHFSEVSPQRYQPPRVAGGYLGENGPSCAGAPSVAGNAFYCPAGDFLAWDETLMAAGYRQIGDAWVYLIIAHEWAHAIQARLQRDQVSVAAELQADCLAGAALQGSVDDGLLLLEPGDTRELTETLRAVADDFPWSDSSSHGNAEQRVAAFNLGTSQGLDGCI
jgi:predicted metalloprotease